MSYSWVKEWENDALQYKGEHHKLFSHGWNNERTKPCNPNVNIIALIHQYKSTRQRWENEAMQYNSKHHRFSFMSKGVKERWAQLILSMKQQRQYKCENMKPCNTQVSIIAPLCMSNKVRERRPCNTNVIIIVFYSWVNEWRIEGPQHKCDDHRLLLTNEFRQYLWCGPLFSHSFIHV